MLTVDRNEGGWSTEHLRVPRGRIGTPTILAGAICLLFSANSFVYGQKPFPMDPADPDEFNCAVSGRVVDDRNVPVARAILVLNDSHQVFTFESDTDGRFLLKSHCGPAPKQRILFVSSPFELGAIAPIEPPDYGLVDLGPAFAGQPILLALNQETEVGDVPVQTYYSKVNLQVLTASGKPFFTRRTNWNYVWLRVRDYRGLIVMETSISEAQRETIAGSVSTIPLYLPEGSWFIEFNLDEDRGPWFAANTAIKVPRSPTAMGVSVGVNSDASGQP